MQNSDSNRIRWAVLFLCTSVFIIVIYGIRDVSSESLSAFVVRWGTAICYMAALLVGMMGAYRWSYHDANESESLSFRTMAYWYAAVAIVGIPLFVLPYLRH